MGHAIRRLFRLSSLVPNYCTKPAPRGQAHGRRPTGCPAAEIPHRRETKSTSLIRQKRDLYPFKFIYKKTPGQVVNTYKAGAAEARARL
ncbi:hypothetical protein EVAR_103784_1 [Eumeta japonica]|uniref:Uncharacterized protein n=1 Tax=Eumeta variegata TaxID=151549 RepID=A0A4C1Z633_EUMVA|nr:hypothetical protein EVAR_103784_1 [Eumeta japonica]